MDPFKRFSKIKYCSVRSLKKKFIIIVQFVYKSWVQNMIDLKDYSDKNIRF